MDKCLKEADLATLKADVKSLFKKFKQFEKQQDIILDLSTSLAVLAKEMQDTRGDVAEIKGDLKEMKSQPAKNYNQVKMLVVGGIIGTIVSMLISNLF